MSYNDIRRGAQLNQELQTYTQYLVTPRTPAVGSRGNREPRVNVFVNPFGTDVTIGDVVAATSNQPSITALASIINATGTGGAVITGTPTGDVVSIGRFSPAKVLWKRATSRQGFAKTSSRTGRRYLAYQNVDNLACPFGRAQQDDDQDDVFAQIKIGVLGVPNFEVSNVSLSRERINYRR